MIYYYEPFFYGGSETIVFDLMVFRNTILTIPVTSTLQEVYGVRFASFPTRHRFVAASGAYNRLADDIGFDITVE